MACVVTTRCRAGEGMRGRHGMKQAKKDAKLHAREEAAAGRKMEAEQQEKQGDATPESEVGEPE
jgi:hypothetical protein